MFTCDVKDFNYIMNFRPSWNYFIYFDSLLLQFHWYKEYFGAVFIFCFNRINEISVHHDCWKFSFFILVLLKCRYFVKTDVFNRFLLCTCLSLSQGYVFPHSLLALQNIFCPSVFLRLSSKFLLGKRTKWNSTRNVNNKLNNPVAK